MPTIEQLHAFGESIWLDTLSRQLIRSGELQDYLNHGVTGVTANPTTIGEAITGSTDYDDDIRRFALAGKSARDIYEELILPDIQATADRLRYTYDNSRGYDGFVSLEVNPHLAHDTEGTIRQARDLFQRLARSNILIKVPATDEGIPAIEQLLSEGVNVNITLIFSIAMYEKVAHAYLKGRERFADAGHTPSRLTSVASFFVSRVDTMVDKELQQIGNTELVGKIGIANTKLAYQRYMQIFSLPAGESVREQAGRSQRPLWASTGTKDPRYPDTYYVDNLMGPDIVNTLPPQTLAAYLDHGTVGRSIDTNLEECWQYMAALNAVGIDFNEITRRLLDEGVEKFTKSFDAMMLSIESKRQTFVDQQRRAA